MYKTKKIIIIIAINVFLLLCSFWAGISFEQSRIRRSGTDKLLGLENNIEQSGTKLEELNRLLINEEGNEQKAIELANSIIIDLSNIRDELRRKSSNIIERATETNKRHEDQLSNFTEREKELGTAVDDVIRELQQ